MLDDNKKLAKLVVILFESKFKTYKENTVQVWVKLLSALPYEKVEKAIEDLIYMKEDFISVGQIVEMLGGSTLDRVNREWEKVRDVCAGKSSAKVDTTAEKIFLSLTSFSKYGYSTDDRWKQNIQMQFRKMYEQKLHETHSVEVMPAKGLIE